MRGHVNIGAGTILGVFLNWYNVGRRLPKDKKRINALSQLYQLTVLCTFLRQIRI